MAELIRLTCPHCGQTLDIPAGLESFSCLYCGTRSQVSALQTPSDDDTPEALRGRLPEAVLRYPDLYKTLDRKHFFDAFARYERENTPLLRALDRCVRSQPEALEPLCLALLDGLEAHMQADPRWAHRRTRSNVFWEVKVVLAIFLTPLARKLALDCAEDFRSTLHRLWLRRWPQERWEPGDYDTLVAGYNRRRLCFITTAVCRHDGLPDDCAELTAFRRFRDGWLTERGDTALIQQYYAVAPFLVSCIEYCDDPDARYEELRTRWLAPCYRALQQERPADCRRLYVQMVQSLAQRYHIPLPPT